MPHDSDTEASSDLSDVDSALLIDTDDPIPTPDTIDSSELLPSTIRKRARKGRAPRAVEAWKHARLHLPHEPERNEHNQKIYYCRYCPWTSVVSNAVRHLRSEHSINVHKSQSLRAQVTENVLKASFSRQELLAHKTAEKSTRNILRNACNKTTYRNAVARLITRQSLSHNLVESPEWTAVCLSLNWMAGPCLINSHATIPRRIASNFNYQRGLVKEALSKAISCIQICTDSWTSGLQNQKEFQAINCQFVDRNGKLCRALLALPELLHGHGGEEVAPHLIKTLQIYDIEDKLGYITGDNASANDTLCRAIETHLQSKGIDWQAAYQRLRCLGHIINLATQAFMFAEDQEAVEVATQRAANSDQTIDDSIAALSKTEAQGWRKAGPLKKLYNLAVALRNLRLHNEFKKLANQLIKIPGETRWNGWFMMIEEAFYTRSAIVQLIDLHPELELYRFTADDWRLLTDTYHFLQPFHEVTKLTEGAGTTLDEMQEKMDFLIDHYRESEIKHSPNPSLLTAINTSWYTFNKYWQLLDEVPAYVTAVLIHPSKRVAYLNAVWSNRRWIKEGIARARSLWHRYKERYSQQPSAAADEDSQTAEPSAWLLYKRRLQVVPVDDDFEAFINAKPTKLAEGTSPLAWWSSTEQRKAYPELSKLAIDNLSAFAMSAASEVVFSGARRTISWERARLGGEVVEHSECSKQWQKAGIAYSDIYDTYGSDSEVEDNDTNHYSPTTSSQGTTDDT
jgi:hypothetical protein